MNNSKNAPIESARLSSSRSSRSSSSSSSGGFTNSSSSYEELSSPSNFSSDPSCSVSPKQFLVARRRLSSVGSVTNNLHTYGLNDDFLILHDEINFQEMIGQGSYGTVFKGTILNNDGVSIEEVAIKRINHADLTDEQERATFLTEAKQSNLAHPCLVKLVAICAEVNCCLIVLELEKGGSLYAFFQANKDPKQLSWAQRLQWAIDMASGMEFLHANDVIHRDIKSENVLLNETQTHAKLCDFGLARTKEKNSTEISGEACGTISYWAPELLAVLSLNITSANKDHLYHYNFYTDTYALILVLWELTSFKRPYSELKKSHADKAAKIINENYRPEIVEGTPPEYAELFTPGWHADISRRLSAKVLHEKLEYIKFNGSVHETVSIKK